MDERDVVALREWHVDPDLGVVMVDSSLTAFVGMSMTTVSRTATKGSKLYTGSFPLSRSAGAMYWSVWMRRFNHKKR